MSAQDLLAAIMRHHGVDVVAEGEWLAAPEHDARIGAWIAQQREHDEAVIAQLDVHVLIEDGRRIVESFAGVGEDADAALRDAMTSFMRNVLHVLLVGFWGRAPDQVEIERWQVGDRNCRAIIGPCSIRHRAPDQAALPPDAFEAVSNAIAGADLAEGANWFRWFYCDNKVTAPVVEALMNNDLWPQGAAALEAVAWPDVEHFWSARQFILLDGA